ncbi:MAG: phosphoribosylglycinamide synthetase C domain-containing protein, partial [Bacillota bacterium]|nr:phosphoribosylglycinamide synthetase C domain-containing protein [Bacillota bacterium]
LERQIKEQILEPTLAGFQKDGLDFKGVLFIGLMISEGGPKVIEFNNRFGDPETQSVLARLESDLLDIFLAVTDNKLADVKIKWKEDKAVCVVLASGGYPGSYEKGKLISGLSDVDEDVIVFHAGTSYGKMPDGSKCASCFEDCDIKQAAIVTSGGRVLGVTALGKTHEEARAKAYDNAKRISFEGMQYRSDIGIINHK